MEIYKNINLSNYTSFKIGGNAKYFAEISSKEDLDKIFSFIKTENLNFFVLGGGTNVLISDEGFNGIVLKINLNNVNIDKKKKLVIVDSGFNLSKLVNICIENGFSGLENLSGIPGTVGGAVRGNAGAYGTEMKDVIEYVTVYDKGNIKKIENKGCEFSYRESKFKSKNSAIILSVAIQLKKGDKKSLLEKSKEIMKMRESKQPLEYANAGSFFKNPIVNTYAAPNYINMPSWKISNCEVKLSAAWLIEKSELKGLRINDVGISEKHSLFIVNYGNGKAKDVIEVMKIAQARVKEKFNIKLQPELEFIGFLDNNKGEINDKSNSIWYFQNKMKLNLI